MCVYVRLCVYIYIYIYFSKRKQITRPNWRYRRKLPRPIVQEASSISRVLHFSSSSVLARSTSFFLYIFSLLLLQLRKRANEHSRTGTRRYATTYKHNHEARFREELGTDWHVSELPGDVGRGGGGQAGRRSMGKPRETELKLLFPRRNDFLRGK